MRDIREDLQERLELVKQQINAEQNRFEKLLKQSSSEQDSKVRYVKAELETVKRVIEIEHRRLGNVRLGTALAPLAADSKPSQQGGKSGKPLRLCRLRVKSRPERRSSFCGNDSKADIMDATRGLIISLSA